MTYREKARSYQSALREIGYKVIEKRVKWFEDEAGNRYGKANADLDMAVDVLLQSENLDRVLLVTGDGDFVQVVRALQNKGCRVEVLAFDNISEELRREADMFVSGYLVPGCCRHEVMITLLRSGVRWVPGCGVIVITTTITKVSGLCVFW
jgi:hypothetical protein